MSKSYETDRLDDREFNLGDENDALRSDGKKERKNKYSILLLLFSFVISLGVWIYVTNLGNDSYEKTLTLVPVSIVGADDLERKNNMSVISGYDNTVTVTLVGKRSEVNKYSASNIYAYVDVSGIQSAERQALPVMIDPLPDISVSVVTPSEIFVQADVIGEKEIDVVVRPTYILEGNYYVDESEITKSAETVTVTGPMSVLDTIKCAVAEVNAGKITASIKSTAPLTLVNEKDVRVQNPYIYCDTTTINISIPVRLKKTISLRCEYADEDFEGYTVSIKLSGENLLVSGDALEVASLEELCIFTLKKNHFDFSGSTVGTFEFVRSVEIDLPEGINNESDFTKVLIEAKIESIPEETTAPAVTTETPSDPNVDPDDNEGEAQ